MANPMRDRLPEPMERPAFRGLLAGAVFGLAMISILALGIFLRVDGLAVPSLWLDEILNAEIAEGLDELPASAWLLGFERENGPLYYASLAAGRALADSPEIALRGPAVVAGILGLLLAGWLGWRLAGPWGALVALALTAVSPLHVVYSREGRTYALLMLLAQGLLVALLLLEGGRKRAPGVLLGLACAAGALYTAATGAPLLATLVITAGGLAWIAGRGDARRRPALALAISGVVGFLAVAGMYGRFPQVEDPAAAFDAGGVLSSWLTGFTTSALDRSPFDPRGFGLLALALAGIWALSQARRTHRGRRLQAGPTVALLVTGFALLPALVALAALAWQDHWLSIRYLSPALPAFLLLVAVGTVAVGHRLAAFARPHFRPFLAGFLILVLLLPMLSWLAPGARREAFVKPDWRRAASWIHALAEPGDQVLAAGDWAWVCIRFYLHRLRATETTNALEVRNAQGSVPVAVEWAREQQAAETPGVTWLVAGGHLRDRGILGWMRRFPTVADRLLGPEIHLHPDLATLAASRGRLDAEALATLGWSSPPAAWHFDHRDGLFLGTGWGGPEVAPDGETFRWAVGRRAELLGPFPPAAGFLELRLRPYRTPQRVTVQLDGRHLGTLELQEGWRDYRLEPALDGGAPEDPSDGGSGLHRLVLEFARATAPRDVEPGSRDQRQLAAAVSEVVVSEVIVGGSVNPGPTGAPEARRPDLPRPASAPP